MVLFDDVFVTGASLLTYAQALRAAGATEVSAVTVVRHVPMRHVNYFDALRLRRLVAPWDWTAERAVISGVYGR